MPSSNNPVVCVYCLVCFQQILNAQLHGQHLPLSVLSLTLWTHSYNVLYCGAPKSTKKPNSHWSQSLLSPPPAGHPKPSKLKFLFPSIIPKGTGATSPFSHSFLYPLILNPCPFPKILGFTCQFQIIFKSVMFFGRTLLVP